MPNVVPAPTGFQARINNYVPAMKYSADVNYNGVTRVSFGAVPAVNATLIANALSTASAGTSDLTATGALPAPYGQCVTLVASGAGGTGVVTLRGWDYLGQPISETVTLTGVTPVSSLKAYKYMQNITYPAAAVTLNIGSSNKLGLPYRSIRAQYEVVNGVSLAVGTFVAAIATDPQTIATGDPRGTYVPATTLDGTTVITVVLDCINDTNTANNGGLHGIRQFAS